jgi:hypothetical protein
MVAALLHHQDIDITVISKTGQTATWVLFNAADHAKTLNWVRIFSRVAGPFKNIM